MHVYLVYFYAAICEINDDDDDEYQTEISNAQFRETTGTNARASTSYCSLTL